MTTDGPASDDFVAIVQVASRFHWSLDERSWDALASCFTEDAVIHFTGAPPIRGRESIVDFIRRGCQRFEFTQHLWGTPSVEVDGDTATAKFNVFAQHVGTGVTAGQQCLVGGRYYDTYRRMPTGWQLAARRIDRVWTSGDAALVAPPAFDDDL